MSLGLDPVRDVRDVSIDDYRANLGEYLHAVASDSWAHGPLAGVGRTVDIATSEVEAERTGEQLLSPEDANRSGRALGLKFDQPISRGAYDVLAKSKQDEIAANTVFRRARAEAGYGTTAWLLGGGTEFLTQVADPVNLASAFIPVIGEARYATMAARMGVLRAGLLRSAVDGVAGQAALEPLTAIDARQRGEDYGMVNTLTNLAFGAGLGVVMHGAHYGAGAGFRFVQSRFRADVPLRVDGEAALAERDARMDEVQKVDEPAPHQPVAEKMEGLRPETKDAALRTAVAQLAGDRPVDIEPVLASDPSWPEIKASIVEMKAHETLQADAARDAQGRLPATEPPADFQPTAEERLAAARLVRGRTPETPLDRPQSLSEFVRKAGGINARGSEMRELLGADLGRQGRQLAGSGQADHVAMAAQEAGYRFGKETRAGNGVDTDAFMKALHEDAAETRKHYPDDAHTEAWRVQQDYFDTVRGHLRDTLGVEPRGMDPRKLAWLMRQDAHTGRLMALVDRVDRLGPDDSLELAWRLDREAEELEWDLLLAGKEAGLDIEDTAVDHREIPARTLDELESFYADHERDLAEQGPEGRRAAADRLAAGRGEEGGGAEADRPGAPDAAPAPAGLRREGGGEGPEAADRGRAADLAEGDLEPVDPAGDVAGETLGNFAQRQQSADLHADTDALTDRDRRLESEAREVQKLLADDVADYGHVLDEDTRGVFELAGKMFDEESKSIDALAACQGGAR